VTVAMTDAAARAILDTGYDTIYDNGTIEYRSGAAPGPSLAATGILLWSKATGANFLAASAGRSKGLTAVLTGAAAGAGVAGHYRLKAAGDTNAVTQNEAREEGTVAILAQIVSGLQNGANYELTTLVNHGYTSGQTATIAGHSAGVANGRWVITVISVTVFSIVAVTGLNGAGGTVHNGDIGIDNTNLAIGQSVSLNTFSKSL
jgi:hypothetical protein